MTLATKDEAAVVKVAIPKDSSLYRTVQEAVLLSAPMRYMDRSAARDIADSVLAALGHSRDTSNDETPFCGPDAQLLEAVRDLLTWAPESGYAEGFGKFAIQTDDCRFYFLEGNEKDEDVEYQALVDNGPLPLLSQPITYAVLGGKHDGRGIMGRVDHLRRVVGLSDD